jgi:hypothetical protein
MWPSATRPLGGGHELLDGKTATGWIARALPRLLLLLALPRRAGNSPNAYCFGSLRRQIVPSGCRMTRVVTGMGIHLSVLANKRRANIVGKRTKSP